MKKNTLLGLVLIGAILTCQAQENKTVQEVSTVKRVVKREGSKVIIQETEAVDKVKGTVIVANNEEENQYFQEDTLVVKDQNILVDETTTDQENEALIAAAKKRQEEELERSKAEAKAKVAEEAKLLAQRKADMEKQLELNRKKLEKRSKGTGKLQKKKKKKRNN